jgi:hypothetical protein
MPIISTFFGIIIRMYFGDHNPPHFHVEFQGEKATFTFDGQLLAGTISSGTARKLVRDWARRHRLELMGKGVRSCILLSASLCATCAVVLPLRLEFDGSIYHLTSRGNPRDYIFDEDADREPTDCPSGTSLRI